MLSLSGIAVSLNLGFTRTKVSNSNDNHVSSGGSRKFWWGGMIKIFSTKPQKFGCVVTRRVARNLQWNSCFRGLGAEPPALKNFAFFCKNNLSLELVWYNNASKCGIEIGSANMIQVVA